MDTKSDEAETKFEVASQEIFKPPYRTQYYLLLCFSFFSFAFYMNIIGSTLDDLSKQMKCPVEQISIALMMRTIVNFLVGVYATFTIHLVNRQIQLVFHFFLYAASSAIVPLLNSIFYFYFQSILSGCAMAYINSIIIQWTIELYSKEPKKLKLYLQILYFMFPFASFASLHSTAPFLSKQVVNSTTVLNHTNDMESKIWIPFIISALLSSLTGFAILYLFFIKPYKPIERHLDDHDRERLHLTEQEESPIPKNFYYLVTVLFLSCYAFQLGQESNTMYYTQHFLLKTSLGLSKSSATYVVSIIYFTYGIGRFINILLSIKVKIGHMIYFNISMMLIANLLIYFCIEYNIWITYSAFAILGFSYSSMTPSLVSFFGKRISQTMKVSTLMVASGTTIATLNHLIVGKIIEHNYNIYRIMSLLYVIIFAFMFISLHSSDLLKLKLLRKKQINVTNIILSEIC